VLGSENKKRGGAKQTRDIHFQRPEEGGSTTVECHWVETKSDKQHDITTDVGPYRITPLHLLTSDYTEDRTTMRTQCKKIQPSLGGEKRK